MTREIRIEIKWSLIYIVVFLIWMGIENITGLHGPRIEQHRFYTNLFALVVIVIYFLALRDKRNNYYNGYMTWQQGFLCGLIISVIVALFSPISQLIAHKIIAPGYFENAINFGIRNGQNEELLRTYYTLRSYIIQSFLSTMSLCILTGAFVALILRRTPKV